MKRTFNITALLLLGVLLFACKKDDFNYPEGYVGSSKITHYATFTMSGDQYMSIVKGGTFTDPGVAAKEGDNILEVTKSGQVNSNVAGLYIITYSAVNADGFPATTQRYVAVLPSAEQAGVNIAGNYDYAAGGTTAKVTKLAPGFYQASNVWSAATTIPAFLITVDGQNILIPTQDTAFGTLSGTAVLSAQGNLNYTVSIPEQGISNSVRRWLKK